MGITKEEWKEWLQLDQTKEFISAMKLMKADILEGTLHNAEDANSLISVIGKASGVSLCIQLVEGVSK